MSGFATVGYFLFTLFFGLVTFLLWLRIGLRYFRISSLHPLSRTIDSLLSPVLIPVDKLFKSAGTRTARFDWPCIFLLIIVELIKFSLMGYLFLQLAPSLFSILLYALADMIIQPCDLLFYAIIIRVIISWINPHLHNTASEIIYLFTEPLLAPARRWVPPVSGFDLSPLIVLLILKIISLFISASLPWGVM